MTETAEHTAYTRANRWTCTMSQKPTYGTAVLWLIANERLDWLDDPKRTIPETVILVSDLFGVGQLQIRKDIKATLDTAGK